MKTNTEKKEQKIYTLDMMFMIDSSEDPLTLGNLKNLVDAARDRLDKILRQEDLEAFGVVDIEYLD